jgi:hypothetical protein
MSGNSRILNVLHKTTTFSLFALTCFGTLTYRAFCCFELKLVEYLLSISFVGAYTVGSGANHIVQRRKEFERTLALQNANPAESQASQPVDTKPN